MGSYDAYTNVSKLVLTVLMFVGRIELIPVVVLFTRSYWRA
jgi:trk system potassium uptake protein